MWSKENAELLVLDPEVFVGKTPEEERICAFVLALGLFFNDSKSLIGMLVKMLDDQPKLDGICQELGEFSALKNYLYRLMYAQIHELHYLLMQHLKEVESIPLYQEIVAQLGEREKASWERVVAMARAEEDPLKTLFKSLRDGLAFHYVRHKELYDGYLAWKQSLEAGKQTSQEGAYVSVGTSVKSTRYYFSDAAVSAWMKKEWAAIYGGKDMDKLSPEDEKLLSDILERNANALSGFINRFVIVRGGKPKRSAYPKFPKKVDA